MRKRRRDALVAELAEAGDDHRRLAQLGAALAEAEAELSQAEDDWLSLSEEGELSGDGISTAGSAPERIAPARRDRTRLSTKCSGLERGRALHGGSDHRRKEMIMRQPTLSSRRAERHPSNGHSDAAGVVSGRSWCCPLLAVQALFLVIAASTMPAHAAGTGSVSGVVRTLTGKPVPQRSGDVPAHTAAAFTTVTAGRRLLQPAEPAVRRLHDRGHGELLRRLCRTRSRSTAPETKDLVLGFQHDTFGHVCRRIRTRHVRPEHDAVPHRRRCDRTELQLRLPVPVLRRAEDAGVHLDQRVPDVHGAAAAAFTRRTSHSSTRTRRLMASSRSGTT